MLSFNPILSQSRATQSLNFFRKGLRSLTPPLEGASPPELCCFSLRSKMSNQVLFPYLQHCLCLVFDEMDHLIPIRSG